MFVQAPHNSMTTQTTTQATTQMIPQMTLQECRLGYQKFDGDYCVVPKYRICSDCSSEFEISTMYRGKQALCSNCRHKDKKDVKYGDYINQTNQTDQTNQINQTNQTKQPKKAYNVPSIADTQVMLVNKEQTPSVKSMPKVTNPNWDEFVEPFQAFTEAWCCRNWFVSDGRVRVDLSRFIEKDPLDYTKSNKTKHSYNWLLNLEHIDTVFLLEGGINDYEKPWDAVFKRTDGLYVRYQGNCCYTGFDVICGGLVTFSENWTTFWNLCLDTDTRSLLKLKLHR